MTRARLVGLGALVALSACASLTGLSGGEDAGGDGHHPATDATGPHDAGVDQKGGADAARKDDRQVAPSDAGASEGSTTSDAPASCDAPGTGAVGTPGCPCNDQGALGCAGNAQTVAVVCINGAWAVRTTCPAGDNCDTTGSSAGKCTGIDPSCADASPGQAVCSSPTRVIKCGPDLVNGSSAGQCTGQACVAGTCVGMCSPGSTQCVSGTTVSTCSSEGAWSDAAACAEPSSRCVDSGCEPVPPAFYVGPLNRLTTDITTTSAAETQQGDLLLLLIYLEPNDETHDAAAYNTLTPPAGFTLAMGEPLSTNNGNLTNQITDESYVYYGYAGVGGAATFTVTAAPSTINYADIAIVTVHGYATTGSPFADPTSHATTTDENLVTAYPTVSIAPAGSNIGFVWFGTTWHEGSFGNPTGYTSLVEGRTLSISYFIQGVAAAETLAPSVASTDLLTANLMSFRAP